MAAFDPRAYWDGRHAKHYGPESVGYAGLGVSYNVWMLLAPNEALKAWQSGGSASALIAHFMH